MFHQIITALQGFTTVQFWLTVGGLLFIVPTVIFVLFTLFPRLGCKTAQGKVIRIEKEYDEEGGLTMIRPVVQFLTYRAEQFEVKTGIGHGLRYLPELHATVKVYYDPKNPQRAQVANRGMWEVSGILVITGLGLMLMGYVIGNSPFLSS